ncbi:hypothetical protein PMG11_04390 [Penicillium brasilianum]|uniref:Zn(2)-C6 fungal-type domain-containing protein n=1 Tax=Penicillium brasilianum TaxID=104259 RepID=A0A0F7VHT6_PENBI|nr:hypothetical protein PMG11_04390 [Penicillium brasilianum]
MPGVPSNKACERCKKRHLKCDETRPQCQRCVTAGVECPGYVQTRKFIDQGATVRRRYAPYQDSHTKPSTSANSHLEDENPLNSAQNEGRTAVHQEKPSQVPPGSGKMGSTFSFQLEPSRPDFGTDTSMAEVPTSTIQPGIAVDATDLRTQDTPASRYGTEINRLADFGNKGGSTRSPLQHSEVSGTAMMGLVPNFENNYNIQPPDRQSYGRPFTSESPSQRSEKEEFQDIFSELMTGTEHEIAFLTRHFAEVLGPWLDLSDAAKFFSVYVPIRALNSQCLKYSMAALAAKQLGRVKGSKSCLGRGMFTSPATTETYPNSEQVDWFLKAANYYYLSVSDLTASTSDGYSVVSTSAVLDSPIDLVGRWLNKQAKQGAGQNLDDGSPFRKTEDILATVTVLTSYKLLDAKGEEWHMYLTGIRQVFNTLLQRVQMNSTFFSHGIRACFWNFARQDYLGSYYIRSATHLDPANTPLWRAAGISIDEQEKFHIIPSGPIELSQEDQTFNGLCWLVSKVVNFLAKSKQSQIAQWTGSPPENPSAAHDISSNSSQQSTYPDTSTWIDLCFEFQKWFEGVPETIRPCVRIEHPRDVSKPPDASQIPFPEVFHSFATCAAAMQHYHFGRIALLLNRPQDVISGPSTAFDRLQGYREVTKEVEHRCREVCGIALGRPHAEVRIYMIPLLFAVGQCLESANERQIIVDLLRGVEADLGWATEYAVEKLHSSWNR